MRAKFRLKRIGGEAYLNLARTFRKSILTSSGIAIGTCILIVVVTLSQTSSAHLNQQIDSFNVNSLTVQSASEIPVNAKSESIAAHFPEVTASGRAWMVTALTPISLFTSDEINGANVVQSPVFAASPGGLRAIGAQVSSGRLFDTGMALRRENVVILGTLLSRELGIALVMAPRVLFIDGQPYSIVGVASNFNGFPLAATGVIVLPHSVKSILSSNLNTLGSGAQYSPTLFIHTRPNWATAVASRIAFALSPRNVSGLVVSSPANTYLLSHVIAQTTTRFLIALALLSALFGGLVIGNTLYLSALTRISEIGLRRALGAKRIDIWLQFVAESLLLSFAGSVVGISIGEVGLVTFTSLYGWVPVERWTLPLEVLALGVAVGLIAGLIPARTAARIEPVRALQR